jgi:hypothetical protein
VPGVAKSSPGVDHQQEYQAEPDLPDQDMALASHPAHVGHLTRDDQQEGTDAIGEDGCHGAVHDEGDADPRPAKLQVGERDHQRQRHEQEADSAAGLDDFERARGNADDVLVPEHWYPHGTHAEHRGIGRQVHQPGNEDFANGHAHQQVDGREGHDPKSRPAEHRQRQGGQRRHGRKLLRGRHPGSPRRQPARAQHRHQRHARPTRLQGCRSQRRPAQPDKVGADQRHRGTVGVRRVLPLPDELHERLAIEEESRRNAGGEDCQAATPRRADFGETAHEGEFLHCDPATVATS